MYYLKKNKRNKQIPDIFCCVGLKKLSLTTNLENVLQRPNVEI